MIKKVLNGNIEKRPPVIVIMGHIDHGKSTLLDYIRKSNIVAGEAGGITQHLGAYELVYTNSDGKTNQITFLDTPGHEAFCSIRERGAVAADIAVLVVSAEDGVKPQTVEALKCIKKENMPFIVAINKIDKQGANIELTKQSLAENEIYVEGYGGDIPVVGISALNGKGVPELLDMIILLADMEDLKADRNKKAEGVIAEATLDNKKGISATILIKDGTLSSGMYIVSHNAYAPVRIMEDGNGKSIKSASFSSPVKIIGWNRLPIVGAEFISLENKREAEEIAEQYKEKVEESIVDNNEKDFLIIPLIIKADATGSLDGIKHELKKIKNDKVKIKIIDEGIGNINESDVKKAQSNKNIIILSFNAKPDAKAKSILERETIQMQSFDIIYNLTEFVKNLVISNVPKEYIDEISGIAKILMIFSKNKDKQILGGKVEKGSIHVGSEVKILRREGEIGIGKIKELQQQKVKASEINEGYEFGALIESKIEIAKGDRIQCFKTIEKKIE